ncbi:MAG: hypothetical protein IPO83_14150 [Chitinophagaceae bacterium]|nr:hypothetical protein [Chitinophagaceae bacterium]
MKLFLDDLELEKSGLSEQIRKVTIELQQHPLYSTVKTIEDIKNLYAVSGMVRVGFYGTIKIA